MNRFRTITRFVRLLIGLFVIAQFAGVISSPLAGVQSRHTEAAFHVHYRHGQDTGGQDTGGQQILGHPGDPTGDPADHCCALHAFFTGVVPAVIAVEAVDVGARRLAADFADITVAVAPGRLDRPPRRLL